MLFARGAITIVIPAIPEPSGSSTQDTSHSGGCTTPVGAAGTTGATAVSV